MNRLRDHLIIHLVLWVLLSILLPLLPIGLGILFATLKKAEFSVFDFLNGVELLLISLGLVSTTGIELFRSGVEWSSRRLFLFSVCLSLIVLGIFNIILLTMIYIEVHDPDLIFDFGIKFTFVQLLVLAISSFTVALQLYIGYIRYKRSMEGETT